MAARLENFIENSDTNVSILHYLSCADVLSLTQISKAAKLLLNAQRAIWLTMFEKEFGISLTSSAQIFARKQADNLSNKPFLEIEFRHLCAEFLRIKSQSRATGSIHMLVVTVERYFYSSVILQTCFENLAELFSDDNIRFLALRGHFHRFIQNFGFRETSFSCQASAMRALTVLLRPGPLHSPNWSQILGTIPVSTSQNIVDLVMTTKNADNAMGLRIEALKACINLSFLPHHLAFFRRRRLDEFIVEMLRQSSDHGGRDGDVALLAVLLQLLRNIIDPTVTPVDDNVEVCRLFARHRTQCLNCKTAVAVVFVVVIVRSLRGFKWHVFMRVQSTVSAVLVAADAHPHDAQVIAACVNLLTCIAGEVKHSLSTMKQTTKTMKFGLFTAALYTVCSFSVSNSFFLSLVCCVLQCGMPTQLLHCVAISCCGWSGAQWCSGPHRWTIASRH